MIAEYFSCPRVSNTAMKIGFQLRTVGVSLPKQLGDQARREMADQADSESVIALVRLQKARRQTKAISLMPLGKPF
jgi:hypothetical protein